MEQNRYYGRIGFITKSISFKEFSYDGNSRTIKGYAAVFGNKDKSGDILIKGCFSKSISERGPESNAKDKIIHLWMHKMDEPVGKITALKEDEKGLYFEAEISNIPLGDRYIEQLKDGTLNQFSIGYEYVWDKMEYDSERDAFIIKEVILYEISVVSIGCNGETEFLGFKSNENPYENFSKEVRESLKGIEKKEMILQLISKAISLGSLGKPREALATQRAEAGEKGIFKNVKFK